MGNKTFILPLGGEGGGGGAQGAQGAQGATGMQGATGLQGANGLQGIAGEIGLQGVMGLQGYSGIQGNDGIQGAKGENGLQGTQGVAGENGIQGIQGLKGEDGIQGTAGSDGLQGADGIQGATGIQGIQGASGGGSKIEILSMTSEELLQFYNDVMNGNILDFSNYTGGGYEIINAYQFNSGLVVGEEHDTYTTDGTEVALILDEKIYRSGSAYYDTGSKIIYYLCVLISPTIFQQFGEPLLFDLELESNVQPDWNQSYSDSPDYIKNKPTIPAAVSGTNDGTNWTSLTIGDVTKSIPSGGAGIQGIQGIAGENGVQGIQGLKGEDGIQGTAGADGLQGADGIQGIQGIAGENGIQGADGLQGADGIQGATGIQGVQGTMGIQGANGAGSGKIDIATMTPAEQLQFYTDFYTNNAKNYWDYCAGGYNICQIDKMSQYVEWQFTEEDSYVTDGTELAIFLGPFHQFHSGTQWGNASGDELEDIYYLVYLFSPTNGLIEAGTRIYSNVQPDWNENRSTNKAFIKNKPTIPDAVSGTNDGTNWTSLTIGDVTKSIPSGGGVQGIQGTAGIQGETGIQGIQGGVPSNSTVELQFVLEDNTMLNYNVYIRL